MTPVAKCFLDQSFTTIAYYWMPRNGKYRVVVRYRYWINGMTSVIVIMLELNNIGFM